MERPDLMRRLLGYFRSFRAGLPAPASQRGPKRPELMTDSDWVRHRAPVRHRDEALSDAAQKWSRRLPEAIRPDELCTRYPRIANRLAQLWRDPGLTEHCLDELLSPRRTGRQGFPQPVADELLALQFCNDDRIYESEIDEA